MSAKKPVFGIDLGTTTSCISLFRNNNVEIIKANGLRLIDSKVCYDIQDGTPYVGQSATQKSNVFDKSKNLSGIKNCIYDVKRFIGRSYSDPRIQEIYKRYPFEVAKSEDGQVEFRLQCANGPLSISPQQVSSEILKYLKDTVNKYISCDIEEEIEAVITVPAYFDNLQRNATIEAANLAGIKVLKLLNEPTAAALHHLYFSGTIDTTLLVFDFGGGTLDISIIEVDSSKNIRVVATEGNPLLGGRDIDNNIFQYMQNEIKQLTFTEKLIRRLRTDAEKIKTHLTQCSSASSEVLSDMDIDLEITLDILNTINEDIFQRCMTLAKECIEQANKTPTDIKEVLLVGGSSLIPKLESLIKEYFSKSEIVQSHDRTEIVCYGAALQASIIKGFLEFDLTISDILNTSLGYEGAGEEMVYIFKKQSKLPITVDHKAVTIIKDQKKIVVNIYEGERKCILYNSFLGSVTLGNLPSGPAGSTFKIKFTTNESGILEVAIEYNEDHAKRITLELNTSKRQDVMYKLEPETNGENFDREFIEFNNIKTQAIYYCKLFMNKDTTSRSTIGNLSKMHCDLQGCKFKQASKDKFNHTCKETLEALIKYHLQQIFIPDFTKLFQ